MLLTKAKPNLMYENINSIMDLILEVHLIDDQIIYVETHTKDKNWQCELKEETVINLFTRSTNIKECPFLKKENFEFYCVLFKDKKEKYYKRFLKLTKQNKQNPVLVINFKRTNRNNSENTIKFKRNAKRV